MSGTLIFRYTAAGFSTLQKAVPLQVAGFHWAVPSTALDKVMKLYGLLYQKIQVCQLGF